MNIDEVLASVAAAEATYNSEQAALVGEYLARVGQYAYAYEI
jgi:hypothetical protein